VGGGCGGGSGGSGGVGLSSTPTAEKSGVIDPYDCGIPEVFVLDVLS
jgi:hypothetical protein